MRLLDVEGSRGLLRFPRQLTKSLLERDFGTKLDLPDDRLCPPIPNRYNYILWIQDLLDSTSDSYADRYDAERTVTGLDM